MPVITIFVKDLDGRSMTFEVKPTETVRRLKELIDERRGIASNMQRLLFGGHQLDNERTLTSYNIRHNATVVLGEKMKMCSRIILL